MASDTPYDSKWLARLFAAHPTLTQRALAKELRVDPSAINRALKGNREIKNREVQKIISFFSEDEQDEEELIENSDHDGIVNDENRLYVTGQFPVIILPEYDVRASAGGGFIVERETVKGEWPFPRSYVESELRVSARNLVVLEVIGDSMHPTLESGDRVLVNMSDCRVSQPGVFVLWDGDGTVVKRLELVPGTEPPKLRRISDNPLHGTYEVLADDTKIVGRAVWYGRRM